MRRNGVLLVDIGNTRIKWAVSSDGELSVQQAEAHAEWTDRNVRDRVIAGSNKPDTVWVSNVGGARIAQLVVDAIQSSWGIAPQFMKTSAVAAGVRCGYAQPEKLGVDRWLGVIAAYHLTRSNACVVGIGTAMTVDGVLGDGQHLGGLIVPGPDMMVASLMSGTSNIARHAADGQLGAKLFADNTLAAVNQGSVHALAALIERCMRGMQKAYGVEPKLIITGGASERVTRELSIPFEMVPDLVLRGLSIASQSAS